LLFERGGWTRTKQGGRRIRADDCGPDDIRFTQPEASEISDFERRPAYAARAWFRELRKYETEEMPKHLEGVMFGLRGSSGSACAPRRDGLPVRSKWRDLLKKGTCQQGDLGGRNQRASQARVSRIWGPTTSLSGWHTLTAIGSGMARTVMKTTIADGTTVIVLRHSCNTTRSTQTNRRR